ncbi:hypothetical protein AB205_0035010 [Aquarana catesbeiana]|uniref:Uncharacterized protein n=1 Tax=Aquarana catesbeiana TaxID=8400 RepID=A0A2G9RE32_AQUCT|nr:hypothetical protein AB205_0035010 [Aquarana catesbeiana]
MTIPKAFDNLSSVEKLCMAGNRLERLNLQTLVTMTHVKVIDLRMNNLTQVTASMEGINHITHFDVRDNQLSSLDLGCMGNLEQLHCERNQLRELRLCGFSLRAIYASSNRLTSINVYLAPSLLHTLDLSRNCLAWVPEWICEAKKLEVLDLSWNAITELPLRIMGSSSLRRLMLGHNQLKSLPCPMESIPLESLDVQHNMLRHLPDSLFTVALKLLSKNLSERHHVQPFICGTYLSVVVSKYVDVCCQSQVSERISKHPGEPPVNVQWRGEWDQAASFLPNQQPSNGPVCSFPDHPYQPQGSASGL